VRFYYFISTTKVILPLKKPVSKFEVSIKLIKYNSHEWLPLEFWRKKVLIIPIRIRADNGITKFDMVTNWKLDFLVKRLFPIRRMF
jgi:hypothetical protein